MKKTLIALLAIVALGFASCSEDNPSSESIFAKKAVHRDNFDKWLLNSYTYPYNIDVKYKMEDIYSDMKYHLVPADSAKAAKLSIIAKYLWFDAYAECVGPYFVKANVPRIIHLIGSPAFNSGQGTMVLGTAEGGLVITLYMVNNLTDKMLTDYATVNDYYFHTMHHEFTHILNQKKPYNTAFDQVTRDAYVNNDWINVNLPAANRAGFVSPYAMMNTGEDFAETFAYYVISTPKQWNDILQRAGNSGAAHITSKANLVKEYALSQWGLDLDKLRETVLRRGGQIATLDLEHFN